MTQIKRISCLGTVWRDRYNQIRCLKAAIALKKSIENNRNFKMNRQFWDKVYRIYGYYLKYPLLSYLNPSIWKRWQANIVLNTEFISSIASRKSTTRIHHFRTIYNDRETLLECTQSAKGHLQHVNASRNPLRASRIRYRISLPLTGLRRPISIDSFDLEIEPDE